MIRNLLDLAIEIRDGICARLATSWPEDDPPWRPDHLHITGLPCGFQQLATDEPCEEQGTHFHHDGPHLVDHRRLPSQPMSPYYADDMVTLYHGDCREVLSEMTAVDAVITDPPYSEHTHKSVRSAKMLSNDRGGRYGADTRRVVDLGFEHLTSDLRETCAAEFARLSARWVLVFSDVESDHLWRASLSGHGLDYVRTGAWVKVGSTPQFSGDRPATAFEAITIAHPPGRKRWNGGGKHAIWQVPIVLDRGRNGARLHPTQKPLPLMRELVALFTDPGEAVLDPFAGSGTTLVAARLEGRRAIGIERDEQHCEVIAERLSHGDAAAGRGVAFQGDLFGGVA